MFVKGTVAREPELLDIEQAAALLQVSETSLRRWTNAGRLPCLRVGGRRERRFRRADLLAFLEVQPGGTPAGHLCGIYMSDRARDRRAADLLGDGLEAGSVCFLVAQPGVRERVFARLARRRPSLHRDLDAGRLVVSEYAPAVADQLEFWETRWAAATRGGARSIQVVGDVSGGSFARPKTFDAVLEYEAAYGTLSARLPVATTCLYDARAHSGLETALMLQLHPDLLHQPVPNLVT